MKTTYDSLPQAREARKQRILNYIAKLITNAIEDSRGSVMVQLNRDGMYLDSNLLYEIVNALGEKGYIYTIMNDNSILVIDV